MSRIIYLAKDNDELVSHCECDDAPITFPPQMDCPWCGCGWLFSCMNCRKGFTFAVGVEIEADWNDLARRDLRKRFEEEPSEEDVEGWVSAMQDMLSEVEVGEQYICLDGHFIPSESDGAEFEGWHAAHNFEVLPQVAALDDPSIIDNVLANEDYWQSNALPDDD